MRLAIPLIVLSVAVAQTTPPTMKQLMVDLIHPAANGILLLINRGGPENDAEWAEARRNALTLAESGNLLIMPGRARDQNQWLKDAKMLGDTGAAAYAAASTKDGQAFQTAAEKLDSSCTTCHKHYRPNVFP